MSTPHVAPAGPTETAAWLRVAAKHLRAASATSLDDTWDLFAIGESLDALAEHLDPIHCLPRPEKPAEADYAPPDLKTWAATPTSFALAEEEQRRG